MAIVYQIWSDDGEAIRVISQRSAERAAVELKPELIAGLKPGDIRSIGERSFLACVEVEA